MVISLGKVYLTFEYCSLAVSSQLMFPAVDVIGSPFFSVDFSYLNRLRSYLIKRLRIRLIKAVAVSIPIEMYAPLCP